MNTHTWLQNLGYAATGTGAAGPAVSLIPLYRWASLFLVLGFALLQGG